MKKYLFILLFTMIIVGCGAEDTVTGQVVREEVIKVGIGTPLTGSLAFMGSNIEKTARLAAEDFDAKIEFIIEDTGCGGGKQGATAVSKMVNVDKVDFIIGGMCSDELLAAAPIVNAHKVPVIYVPTGGGNVDNAGEYIFRNGPSDVIAGTRPAKEIYEDFNVEKVALVTDLAEYTLDIAENFRGSYEGEVVVDETVDVDSTDLRTVLTKIKNSDAEAIFVNSQTGTSAAYLIKQAKEMGIDLPIFGNFLAYTADNKRIAGDALNGVYVYDPEFNEGDPEMELFFAKYRVEYGFDSPIKFHTAGTYDALRMGLEAVEAVGNDGEDIHDYLLENIQDWQGFNGLVSLDSKGNSGTGFVLKVVKDGELVNP